MGQTTSKHDITLQSLYYDAMKVPTAAYHMVDKLTEGIVDPPENEVALITRTFPKHKIVTDADMPHDPYYRLSKSCDIVEIISHDPYCKLRASDFEIQLGVGRFSFLTFSCGLISFSVQHATNLEAANGRPLLLEIKYYVFPEKLKSDFPDKLNFKLHGQLYGMAGATIGKIETPLQTIIGGSYKPQLVRTDYVTVAITSLDIEKLVDDPRLKTFARNKSIDMIYDTMPRHIKASVPTAKRQEFTDLLDEILGQQHENGVSLMKGGYNARWNEENDQDEIPQSEEDKDRQIAADVQENFARVTTNLQKLLDGGVLTYQLPE